jgi:hypothetical protein
MDPWFYIMPGRMVGARAIRTSTKAAKYQRAGLAKLKTVQRFATKHGVKGTIYTVLGKTSFTEELEKLIAHVEQLIDFNESTIHHMKDEQANGIPLRRDIETIRCMREIEKQGHF